LKEKIIIFITPDEYVLKDESKRVEVFEYTEDLNYDDFEIINASNGLIIINVFKKNVLFEFNIKSHYIRFNKFISDKFFFFGLNIFNIGFSSYCLFFLIPTIFLFFKKRIL
jgi:hypothetical protein